MTAEHLIVWRHGRTEWNASARFQGQADIPLDDTGRVQASRAARVLAGMRPVRIVSSDLSRATATAQVLADRCGIAVECDPRLREVHVGSWEGLTTGEILAADPDLARRYLDGEDVRRSATGETVAEVGERAALALAEIGEAAPDGSVVVVAAHGVSGRAGVCRLVGLPYDAWHLLGSLHNCGWIRVDRHRHGYWRIGEYNVTAQLPGTDEPPPGS